MQNKPAEFGMAKRHANSETARGGGPSLQLQPLHSPHTRPVTTLRWEVQVDRVVPAQYE